MGREGGRERKTKGPSHRERERLCSLIKESRAPASRQSCRTVAIETSNCSIVSQCSKCSWTCLLPSLSPAPLCDTLGCCTVALGRTKAKGCTYTQCGELGILITGPRSRRRQCLARRQRPRSLLWRPGRQWWTRLPRLRRCA